MSDHVWPTTVDELVRIFRDALAALVPIVERARMPHEEPHAYDDWDGIAQAVFRSIVERSIQNSQEVAHDLSLGTYGVADEDYLDRSYLVVHHASHPGVRYIFRGLACSDTGHFDLVRAVEERGLSGDDIDLPPASSAFALQIPSRSGEITDLHVDL